MPNTTGYSFGDVVLVPFPFTDQTASKKRPAVVVSADAYHIRVGEMNEAVLQAIEQHALTPEAVAQVIALTERDDARELHEALERERRDVDRRIQRLIVAVETAGDISSLTAKLRELEARRNTLNDQLRNLHPVPRLAPAIIESRLAEWRRLLRASTTQGRAVLQRVLRGRIVFTPSGKGYTFEAPTRFDKLFSGVAAPRPAFIAKSNRGTEHIGPEDTFDGDYGRLLQQAMAPFVESGKRMASPPGFGAAGAVRRTAPQTGRAVGQPSPEGRWRP